MKKASENVQKLIFWREKRSRVWHAGMQSENKKQAGAELCQAQVKLGLAKIEVFFHLIEN